MGSLAPTCWFQQNPCCEHELHRAVSRDFHENREIPVPAKSLGSNPENLVALAADHYQHPPPSQQANRDVRLKISFDRERISGLAGAVKEHLNKLPSWRPSTAKLVKLETLLNSEAGLAGMRPRHWHVHVRQKKTPAQGRGLIASSATTIIAR
jgi:hypothetical protein